MLSDPTQREAVGLVRPMERHDLAVVSGLTARLAHHHGDTSMVDVANLAADLFGPTPRHHGLVAERFGYVVGYALMTARQGTHVSQCGLELCHLFLLEGSRGLGLGRRLVEGIMEIACGQGCELLVVDTYPANRNARAFYEALGFAPRADGVLGLALALDGAPLRTPA